jgi:tetratricopeptide (TPR) repeat protein
MSMMQQSGPPPAGSPNYPSAATLRQLADTNEATWLDLGRLAESMGDWKRAKEAYEGAIKNNPESLPAKKALALLFKDKLKDIDGVGPGRGVVVDMIGRGLSSRVPSTELSSGRHLGIAWFDHLLT